MLKMVLSQPEIRMRIEPAKVVYQGGEAYEGDYEVVPKAFEPVVLPTKNKLLADDVTVTKVPYYEVSNETGTTVYMHRRCKFWAEVNLSMAARCC